MAEPAAPLKVGDRVLYVPHVHHALEEDHQGNRLFTFHHLEAGHTRVSGGNAVAHAKGAQVLWHVQESTRLNREAPGGPLKTVKGHPVTPGRPTRFWDAVVRQLNADGSADLDIAHPYGQVEPGKMRATITHHKPDREAVRAHMAEVKRALDGEAQAFAAGVPLSYEVPGPNDEPRKATRDEWRAHLTARLRDPDSLTDVPGIPYDPTGQQLHSFHRIGEVSA